MKQPLRGPRDNGVSNHFVGAPFSRWSIIKTKLLLDVIVDMRQTMRTVCQCQRLGRYDVHLGALTQGVYNFYLVNQA